LNIAVRTANDAGSLARTVDAACEELGIKFQSLDVATRDRLVERILKMLGSAS
jgi:hypothetical protein